ncbi:MAG: HNH endonuclease [Prevotella sp.]|nr:HNH endonuclease [Prevotella sp.]
MRTKPNKGDRWSRDEMIVVLNLYFKLPFGKMDHRTPEVNELANIMGRTNNSVAMRLNNFASCDPMLIERGIKALGDHRKQCQPYWDGFYNNQEGLIFESEKILAEYQNTDIESKYKEILTNIPDYVKGETRMRMIKTRVNQNFFRKMVLANYDGKCALTGIDVSQLLVASHIIPWSKNEVERLNPENGICLSSLYDQSFDKGLISFTNEGKVILSDYLKSNISKEYYARYFASIEGMQLSMPNKYFPNPAFLEWHRDMVFNK